MRDHKAYLAMFYFLDERYKQIPSDDLGGLLGQLSLDIWANGTPGDPGVVEEWNRALDAAEREMAQHGTPPLLQKAS